MLEVKTKYKTKSEIVGFEIGWEWKWDAYYELDRCNA